MTSVLERLEKLEASMSEVVARVTSPDPMVQMLMQKTVGIEQSVMSMGKTLSAMSEELTENGTLDGAAVIARLRRAEDENSKEQVKLLLKEDTIEVVDKVSPTSLVVLEQKVVNTKTGEAMVVSNYNLVGMSSPMTNQVWRSSLQEKAVGDTVRGIAGNDEEEILTVKEIYEIKERDVEGEDPQFEDVEGSPAVDTPQDGSEEELSFDEGSDEEEAGA